jgi:hypothetical protein
MAYRRWYPSVTTLPNGQALVTAGSDVNTTSYIPIPEVYNPLTGTWRKLTTANQVIPNYPFMFVLPDGRVLAAGSDESPMATYALDLTSETWSVVDATPLDAGSAVMYAPGKVMKSGRRTRRRRRTTGLQALLAQHLRADMTPALGLAADGPDGVPANAPQPDGAARRPVPATGG